VENLLIFFSEKEFTDFLNLSNILKNKEIWLSDQLNGYMKQTIGIVINLNKQGYPTAFEGMEDLPAEVDDLEGHLHKYIGYINFCYFRDLKILDDINNFQRSNKYFDPSKKLS
jgi:hypothetical protein